MDAASTQVDGRGVFWGGGFCGAFETEGSLVGELGNPRLNRTTLWTTNSHFHYEIRLLLLSRLFSHAHTHQHIQPTQSSYVNLLNELIVWHQPAKSGEEKKNNLKHDLQIIHM